MKAILIQEKIIKECIRIAKELIEKNIALDFSLLINDKGDLTYINPFNPRMRSNKYLRRESIFTRVQRYCEFQLFQGNYSDYVNVYFQTNVSIGSRKYKNAIIVTGNHKTTEDFGYHIFAYMISRTGQLRVFRPLKAGYYEFHYLIKNEVLDLLENIKEN